MSDAEREGANLEDLQALIEGTGAAHAMPPHAPPNTGPN